MYGNTYGTALNNYFSKIKEIFKTPVIDESERHDMSFLDMDCAIPVVRKFKSSKYSLHDIETSAAPNPMQAINFYCKYCCTNPDRGEFHITCRKSNCPFGIIKQKLVDKNGELLCVTKNNIPK